MERNVCSLINIVPLSTGRPCWLVNDFHMEGLQSSGYRGPFDHLVKGWATSQTRVTTVRWSERTWQWKRDGSAIPSRFGAFQVLAVASSTARSELRQRPPHFNLNLVISVHQACAEPPTEVELNEYWSSLAGIVTMGSASPTSTRTSDLHRRHPTLPHPASARQPATTPRSTASDCVQASHLLSGTSRSTSRSTP